MDKRIGLAAGVFGLWLGLALALGGGIGLADIANWGYVVGLVGGGVLAYGIGRLVTKRR